jgi:hypothetical protein
MATLKLGEETNFLIPKGYLMVISPYFKAYLTTSLTQEQTNVITIEDSITPKDFHEFVEALAPTSNLPNRLLL